MPPLQKYKQPLVTPPCQPRCSAVLWTKSYAQLSRTARLLLPAQVPLLVLQPVIYDSLTSSATMQEASLLTISARVSYATANPSRQPLYDRLQLSVQLWNQGQLAASCAKQTRTAHMQNPPRTASRSPLCASSLAVGAIRLNGFTKSPMGSAT